MRAPLSHHRATQVARAVLGGLIALGFVLIVSPPLGGAQEAEPEAQSKENEPKGEQEKEEQVEAAQESEAGRKARGLASILESQRLLSAELAALQAELETDAARGRENQILAEIEDLSNKLAELEVNFSELAAEIDPAELADDEESASFDLGGELRELLGPLVSELKRATSRPREMDRLRTDIDRTEDKIERIQSGLANLAVLTAGVQSPTLRLALERERDDWIALHLELATRYEIDRQKLHQMESEQASFSEVLEGVFELFFKSRGRNLILALGATMLFLLLLRRLHTRALETSALRRRGDALLPRVLNLLFVVFMGIGGVLVFLLVLYLFGDWVLLILMLLLVFGALWASKQAIPHFWTQATVLLNLGPVREGERLVYRGLPWRISRLNFYTELENERLTGGTLRLPIGDLTDFRSREIVPDEPWFPSAVDDWVVLGDGTFGCVVLQSPDQVVLRLMGGAIKTLATADYLALNPTNVTGGYTANLIFGLDYAHQAEITTTIPEAMQRFVREHVVDTPIGAFVEDIEVFFDTAGASSLDLRVIATLSGEGASFYKIVPRILSRLCVDACNAHGWVIPFKQVTVHTAAEQEPSAAGS